MIETLFFDADGVIQFPGPGFRERFERLLAGRATVPQLFRTEETTIDGSRDLREVLAEFIATYDVPTTPDELIVGWYNIYVNEPRLALVDELRAKGYPCYLTTNQQAYRGAYIQEHLPYQKHFDGVFYSYEMLAAKPSPAFFQTVLRETGADPATTLFIDDLEPNVVAAKENGLNADVCAWNLDMPTPTDDSALRAILGRHGLPV